MIFVLAGNHRQFRDFCRATGLTYSNAVYVFSHNQIRGRRGELLIRVGTWRQDHMLNEAICNIARHLEWRIEDWDETKDSLRLRTQAYRSTQDMASARSATS